MVKGKIFFNALTESLSNQVTSIYLSSIFNVILSSSSTTLLCELFIVELLLVIEEDEAHEHNKNVDVVISNSFLIKCFIYLASNSLLVYHFF